MESSISSFLIILIVFMWSGTASKNGQPINVGDKVHLLCQYIGPIEGCSFVIPGEESEIDLEPENNQENYKYTYFGKGFDQGECGITIENVSASNEGYATCILALNSTFELYEAIEVRIINLNDIEMSLPKMKILNNNPLIVGQTLAAECAVKSHTDVNILWLLNDRILNKTNVAMVKKKYERDKGLVFEFKSILKYDSLDIRDNGSILRCRIKVGNNSTEFIDSSILLVVQNETIFSEPEIGNPYDISIKFFAFPRVLSSRWKVNDRIIYYGKATNEFLSKELKYLGNNQYEAFLHIMNLTEENIHYNYTLQVIDSEGAKFYHQKLDNLNTNKLMDENITFKAITSNSVTTAHPKYPKEKQHNSNLTSRRTTTRNFNGTYESIAQSTAMPIERKIKLIRKQQQQTSQNTSTTMTEMTSVIGSTTTLTTSTQASSTAISLVAEKTTNKAKTKSSVKIIKYENDINPNTASSSNDDDANSELANNYFDITKYEVINTTKNAGGSTGLDINHGAKLQNIFIASIFFILILVIIIISTLLCHYRHQVSILKTEIIQMNLESYYNQSCLYPSNFNEYSATSIQRNELALICDNKRSYSESSGESFNVFQTYNTNSHLYQSIDEIIDTHVYDEIINSMEENNDSQRVVDEKLNNYENNESFNNINEILIPQHCHTLMTIEEVDECESSQSQKLSNMESTYI